MNFTHVVKNRNRSIVYAGSEEDAHKQAAAYNALYQTSEYYVEEYRP